MCRLVSGSLLLVVLSAYSVFGQREFPSNFKFGTASASYQIEGFNTADGKGPSIWDDFVKIPGKIADGSSGDHGPDSYVYYKDDVQLIKAAGFQFYRFSISWTRIMPDGTPASLNEAGLLYYDNLIDELLANGIEPIVTMYHWDMPSRIHDLGGLTTPLFPLYFEQYAKVLFERYGDRVKTWITFNEPNIYCNMGYSTGDMAPGLNVTGGEYYCIYHSQLAHARAYHLYKDQFYATQQGRVGMTFMCYGFFPKDPSNPVDVAAVERAYQFNLGVYAQPIMLGGFPDIVREYVDRFSEEEGQAWSRLPEYDQETMEYVRGTFDFMGLNYYTSYLVSGAQEGLRKLPKIDDDVRASLSTDPTWVRGGTFWMHCVPEGLRDLLLWIKDNYNGVETLITENGWGDNGGLDDGDRVEYLRQHFNAVLDAIGGGANVTAHTTWSVVDVFEWASGYTVTFGIHHVDPETKLRTPKKSVGFLKELTATRTVPLKVPSEKFP